MPIPIPKGFLYGTNLPPVSVGSRQVASNPASKTASPPIDVDRWCRNGKHPSADLENRLHEATNQAILYRTKELFSCVAPLQNCLNNPATSDRDRWRFAFKTGPYTHAVLAVVVMLPTNVDIAPWSTYNTGARLDIFSDTAEATVVATENFMYGSYPHGTSGQNLGFADIKVLEKVIDGLSPSTTYYARFTDENIGRIQSACVGDLQSMTENFDGYLSENIANGTNIVSSYRSKLIDASNALLQSGSKVFTWTVDDGTAPVTRAVNTPANIIDTTVTTVSANSPGFTVDLTGKARVSQTSGVPVTMQVFAKTSSAGGEGRVYLKNSAGTAVMTMTNVFATTSGWLSVTGFLPASSGKYDLQFDNNGAGTLSVYAVSVYES